MTYKKLIYTVPNITCKSDIYSFGILMLDLVFGERVFDVLLEGK